MYNMKTIVSIEAPWLEDDNLSHSDVQRAQKNK